MKKNLLIAAFSAVAMLFASCEKSPAPVNPDNGNGTDPQPKPEAVEVNPASHEFTADGGTFDVTVKSSADWTVTPAEEAWVKPSVTSGKDGAKVTFTAEKNSTTEARAAVFTFKVGKKSATFRVSQVAGEAPKPAEISLSATSHEFTAKGGSFELTVTSSVDWKVTPEMESWVSPVVTSGQSGAKVMFMAKPNTEAKTRNAVFTFTAGSATAKFTVSQAAAETSNAQLEFQNPAAANTRVGVNGGSKLVSLTTNIPNDQLKLAISAEGQSWISIAMGGAVTNNMFGLTIAANEGAERTATVTISGPGAADLIMTVTQDGKPQTGGGEGGYSKWIGNWEWKSSGQAPVALTFAEKEKGVSYTVSFTGKSELPSFTVLYQAANEGLLFTKIADCGKFQGLKVKFAARYHYEGGAEFSTDCNMFEDRMNIAEMSMTGSEGKTGKIYDSVYGDPFADMGLFFEVDQWTNKALEPRLALPATMVKK